MRAWAERAAGAENENARDLEVARRERDEARRDRDEARAALAAKHGGFIGGDLS
jgi:hypothetical protein